MAQTLRAVVREAMDAGVSRDALIRDIQEKYGVDATVADLDAPLEQQEERFETQAAPVGVAEVEEQGPWGKLTEAAQQVLGESLAKEGERRELWAPLGPTSPEARIAAGLPPELPPGPFEPRSEAEVRLEAMGELGQRVVGERALRMPRHEARASVLRDLEARDFAFGPVEEKNFQRWQAQTSAQQHLDSIVSTFGFDMESEQSKDLLAAWTDKTLKNRAQEARGDVQGPAAEVKPRKAPSAFEVAFGGVTPERQIEARRRGEQRVAEGERRRRVYAARKTRNDAARAADPEFARKEAYARGELPVEAYLEEAARSYEPGVGPFEFAGTVEGLAERIKNQRIAASGIEDLTEWLRADGFLPPETDVEAYAGRDWRPGDDVDAMLNAPARVLAFWAGMAAATARAVPEYGEVGGELVQEIAGEAQTQVQRAQLPGDWENLGDSTVPVWVPTPSGEAERLDEESAARRVRINRLLERAGAKVLEHHQAFNDQIDLFIDQDTTWWQDWRRNMADLASGIFDIGAVALGLKRTPEELALIEEGARPEEAALEAGVHFAEDLGAGALASIATLVQRPGDMVEYMPFDTVLMVGPFLPGVKRALSPGAKPRQLSSVQKAALKRLDTPEGQRVLDVVESGYNRLKERLFGGPRRAGRAASAFWTRALDNMARSVESEMTALNTALMQEGRAVRSGLEAGGARMAAELAEGRTEVLPGRLLEEGLPVAVPEAPLVPDVPILDVGGIESHLADVQRAQERYFRKSRAGEDLLEFGVSDLEREAYLVDLRRTEIMAERALRKARAREPWAQSDLEAINRELASVKEEIATTADTDALGAEAYYNELQSHADQLEGILREEGFEVGVVREPTSPPELAGVEFTPPEFALEQAQRIAEARSWRGVMAGLAPEVVSLLERGPAQGGGIMAIGDDLVQQHGPQLEAALGYQKRLAQDSVNQLDPGTPEHSRATNLLNESAQELSRLQARRRGIGFDEEVGVPPAEGFRASEVDMATVTLEQAEARLATAKSRVTDVNQRRSELGKEIGRLRLRAKREKDLKKREALEERRRELTAQWARLQKGQVRDRAPGETPQHAEVPQEGKAHDVPPGDIYERAYKERADADALVKGLRRRETFRRLEEAVREPGAPVREVDPVAAAAIAGEGPPSRPNWSGDPVVPPSDPVSIKQHRVLVDIEDGTLTEVHPGAGLPVREFVPATVRWGPDSTRFLEQTQRVHGLDAVEHFDDIMRRALDHNQTTILGSRQMRSRVADRVLSRVEEMRAARFGPGAQARFRQSLDSLLQRSSLLKPELDKRVSLAGKRLVLDLGEGVALDVMDDIARVVLDDPVTRALVEREALHVAAQRAGGIAIKNYQAAKWREFRDEILEWSLGRELVDEDITKVADAVWRGVWAPGEGSLPALLPVDPNTVIPLLRERYGSSQPGRLRDVVGRLRGGPLSRGYRRVYDPSDPTARDVIDFLQISKEQGQSVWMDSGAWQALKWHARAMNRVAEDGPWMSLVRLVKANLTARSMPTLINNMLSNISMQMVRRGDPVLPGEVFHDAFEWAAFGKNMHNEMLRSIETIRRGEELTPSQSKNLMKALSGGRRDRDIILEAMQKERGTELGAEAQAQLTVALNRLEAGIQDRARMWEAIERTGVVDTTRIEGELGSLQRKGLTEYLPGQVFGVPTSDLARVLFQGRGLPGEKIKGVFGTQEAVYRGSDNIFKINETAYRYKEAKTYLDALEDGQWVEYRTGPTSYARVTRKDDLYMIDDGRRAVGVDKNDPRLHDVMAKAGAKEAQDLFFDYTDMPLVGSWVRAMPAVDVFNPFYSWFIKALWLPGKPGLPSAIVRGGIDVRTNSRLVRNALLRRAVDTSMRRAAMVSTISGYIQTEPGRRAITELMKYIPNEMAVGILGTLNQEGGFQHWDKSHAWFASAADVPLRIAARAEAALFDKTPDEIQNEARAGLYRFENLWPRYGENHPLVRQGLRNKNAINYELSGWEGDEAEEIKRRRRLMVAALQGRLALGADFFELIGLGQSPIKQIWETWEQEKDLAKAARPGARLADWERWFRGIGPALFSNTAWRLLVEGSAAAVDPASGVSGYAYEGRRLAEPTERISPGMFVAGRLTNTLPTRFSVFEEEGVGPSVKRTFDRMQSFWKANTIQPLVDRKNTLMNEGKALIPVLRRAEAAQDTTVLEEVRPRFEEIAQEVRALDGEIKYQTDIWRVEGRKYQKGLTQGMKLYQDMIRTRRIRAKRRWRARQAQQGVSP